jgi:hypothetical protein
MIITSAIEHYLDEYTHLNVMRRAAFFGYSRGEITGDYTDAMYSQLLMYSAQDTVLSIYKNMTEEERMSAMDWTCL